MRIALIADAHLATGKASRLDPEMGLDQTLCDRYRAFEWCFRDAAERADLILVAGDTFDSQNPTTTERWLALQALQPAIHEGKRVVILTGNHEMGKAAAERDATDHLANADHQVWVFGKEQMIGDDRRPWLEVHANAAFLIPCRKPVNDADLYVARCPWPNRQQLLASRPDLTPMGAEAAIREAMMDVLRGLAADRLPGVPSILLGHFSVDLAEAGSESRMMGLGSEWTLGAYDVAGLGFDAALLGHIHCPQQVAGLPMWYAGSPCEMDFGERDQQHGYWLFDLNDTLGGLRRDMTAEFRDNPHNRRHMKITLGTDPWPDDPAVFSGARVWVAIPPNRDEDEAAIAYELEAAGALEWRIDHQPRPSERRRETGLTDGMGRWEQLEAYLKQTHPNEDIPALIEEARTVEATP